jgi:hypothetical protein
MQQSGRRTVQVPADVERAVEESVVHHLRTEFAARGLLLTADALRRANAEAAQHGKSLLAGLITRCYGIQPQGSAAVSFQFQSEEGRAHVQAALAFGATTAIVLAPFKDGTKQDFGRIELLCAIFNLGIGLVDSLCDEDSGIGMILLGCLNGDKLTECAEVPRQRGWLRSALPAALAGVAAVAFAADLIEVFFQELHAAYPGHRSLHQRRGIGTQLTAALEAERDSVCWLPDMVERERSLQSSRLTSVLPLQIIESLACASITEERSAGTLLGEALWRVDDLVDLCQDARCGALNSLLLRAMHDDPRSVKGHDPVTALERLLGSTDIGEVAAEAAECLVAGLRLGDGVQPAERGSTIPAFLCFIQSYAGVPPATGS